MTVSWSGPLGSGNQVAVWDLTAGSLVGSCTSAAATSCQVMSAGDPAPFVSGGPHYYQAFLAPQGGDARVAPVTRSNQVLLSRAAWTVDLTWSTAHVGGTVDAEPVLRGTDVVTVTATANQPMPSTQPYVVRVIDQDGTQMCQSTRPAVTCSFTTSVEDEARWPLRAQVAQPGGSDIQAWSSPVSFSRAPYQVNVSTAVAADTTVTVTLSRALDAGDSVEIWNASSGTKLTTCTSSSPVPCAATETGQTGASYQALVIRGGATVASSSVVSSTAGAYRVALSATDDSVKAGQVVTLTASINQSLTGSLRIAITDTWQSNRVIRNCASVLTCSVNVTYYDGYRPTQVGSDRRYVAYVSTVNTQTNQLGTDVRAQSGPVDLRPWPWAVSLTTSSTIFKAGQAPTLTARETTGQDVGLTAGNYQVVTMDVTMGYNIKYCSTSGPSTPCVGTISSNQQYGRFTSGYRHAYRAFIGKPDTSPGVGNKAVPSPLAAVSGEVRLARQAWVISWDGTTARWNQDLNGTIPDSLNSAYAAYKVFIVDRDLWPTGGSGMVLGSCSANNSGTPLTSCTPSLSTLNGQYVRTLAVIAGVGWDATRDLQATSDGYSANPWLGQMDPLAQPGGMSKCAVDEAADPCNPSTGEYYENFTDLALPGRMPALAQRTYTSKRATTLGLFGYGWFSNLDAALRRPTTSTDGIALDPVEVDLGTGAVAKFDQFKGSDVFAARDGVNADLVKTSDLNGSAPGATAGYVLTSNDGARLWFDDNGKLLAKLDRAGNKVAYTRTPTSITATTDGGRALVVALNADGTAATLTGPEGRSLAYAYDADKNLVSVTDTRGKVWRYSYATPANHLVTGKQTPSQNAAGVSVVNTYDTSKRIATQSIPINAASGGTTPQTAVTTFAYSGQWPNITVTVTGPKTTTAYEYVQGYLATKTLNPAGPGAAQTRYSYDLDGNRVQVVDADGVTALAAYDGDGHQISATDSAGNVTSWTVDRYGAITSETFTDSTGTHTSTVEVDQLGRATRSTVHNPAASGPQPHDAPADRSVTELVYGDPGHPSDITRIIDPTGVVTDYTYSDEGFLASATRSSTSPAYTVKHTWTYNAYGDIRVHGLPRANCTVTTGPDACDPAAVETTTYLAGTSLPQQVTLPSNNAGSSATRTAATFSYDNDGRLSTATDGAGVTTTTTYWLNGLPRTVSTPLGGARTVDYDGEGNPLRTTTRITSTLDAVETRTYNALGLLATKVAAEGNKAGQTAAGKTARTVTYTYTRAGRPKAASVPDPAGGTIAASTVYDFAGRPWKAVDPEGRTTTTTYGRDNQVLAVQAPDGAVTSYTWDPDGNLAAVTEPAYTRAGSSAATALTTTYTYDRAGRPVAAAQASGSSAPLTTTYTYTGAGDLLTIESPNGNASPAAGDHITTIGFAPDGTPVSVTDPDGATTTTRTALDGTPITTIDAAGRATTSQYDAAGRLTAALRPGSAPSTTETTKYAYDGDGRLASIEPPRSTAGSILWTFGYDLAGRRTSLTDPLARTTGYAFDLEGNLTAEATRIGGPAGTITYGRDPLGRAISTSYGDGAPGSTTSYYKDSQPKTVTDATGTTTWTYDAAGRPATRTGGSNGPWAWTWNPDGTPATRTRPSGLVESFTNDAYSRLATINDPTGVLASLTYDADGNPASVAGPAGRESYSYDGSGDLVEIISGQATSPPLARTITRTPDGMPDLVTTTRGATTEHRRYDYDGTGRLQGVCPTTAACTAAAASEWYAYDPHGNRTAATTTAGTTTWTYNDADQPATRAGAGGNATYTIDNNGNVLDDGRSTATYRLDGRTRTATAGGTTHTYTLDAAGTRAADTYGVTTTALAADPLDPARILTIGSGTGAQEYFHGPHGPTAMTTGGTAVFLAHDVDGSVTDTILAGNALGRSVAFTAYGQPVTTVPGAPGSPSGPVPALGYKGMLATGVAGTSYTPARVYGPADGAFTGPDPLLMSSGPNWNGPAVFANGNPAVFSDPTGMSAIDSIGDFLAAYTVNTATAALGVVDGFDPLGWRKAVTDSLGMGDLGGLEDFCSGFYNTGKLGGEIASMFVGGMGIFKAIKFAGKAGLGFTRLGLAGLRGFVTKAISKGAVRDLVKLPPQSFRVPAPAALRSNAADTGGGGFLSRLRSMNWADDTGAVTVPGRSESKLIYEANPKHGPVSRPGPRGEISRAPRGDCQAMLECSTLIGPRIREGIEPETGLQVIFRQHREFEGTEWWHGYVPGG